MSYDPEPDINRVRSLLSDQGNVSETKVVGGGLGFMVNGHLCCGVSYRGLTVRVGPGQKADALKNPRVGPLQVGSREASAFVVVEPGGIRTDESLRRWIDRALEFVDTLSADP